jgi:hypothetical protein
MLGVLMLSARYLPLFASLVLSLCWVLSMAYALMVLIGLSVGERVGLAVVPVIQSGCEVCVISVRIQESPFSTSNGEGVHPNQVDAYLMAELGTNSLKNLW